jgi:hypothetical protein
LFSIKKHMKKIALFYGLIIGLTTSLIGIYLYIYIFTPYSFLGGLQLLKFEGKLGKIITLGTILNIGMFFGLLKYKKETMAKGIILTIILLTIITLFI